MHKRSQSSGCGASRHFFDGPRLARLCSRKTLSSTLNSRSEFITSGISRGGICGGEKGNLLHFLQFQLNPQQSQHLQPLLSWDQLLIFDIELDNQKLPLSLSLLLGGSISKWICYSHSRYAWDSASYGFGIERDDMLKRVLA